MFIFLLGLISALMFIFSRIMLIIFKIVVFGISKDNFEEILADAISKFDLDENIISYKAKQKKSINWS